MEHSKSLEFDHFFMNIAFEMSKQSHCVKKKVGAIISKNTRIISSGYNGPPEGTYNCDIMWPETGCPRTATGGCSYSLHAEQNAIIFAYKNNINLKGTTLYITLSPCLPCARLIFNSGIKRVLFSEYYSGYKNINIEEGINFLKEFKIEVDSI